MSTRTTRPQKHLARQRAFTRRIFSGGSVAQMRNNLSELIGEADYERYFRTITCPSTPLGATLRGVRFPSTPGDLRPNTSISHNSCFAAVEYTAGLLLADAPLLQIFEHFRYEVPDASIHSESPSQRFTQGLKEAERRLGFTLWFSALWMAKSPPGSQDLIDRTRSILDANPNGATHIASLYLFRRRSSAHTAKQVTELVDSSGLPEKVRSFLLSVIHPAPPLHPEAVAQALSIAAMCPAIDQWFLLLRSCQALYAGGHASSLKHTKLLPQLLRSIPTLETSRLLSVLFDESTHTPISSQASTDTEDDVFAPTYTELLRRAGSESQEDAVGALATLSKLSLETSGFSLGPALEASVNILSSLTELRSGSAQRWYDVVNDANEQPAVRDFLLVPDEHTAQFSAALNAARASNWIKALSLLDSLPSSRETSALRIEVYLQTGDSQQALSAASVASVEHPTLRHRLPLKDLATLIPDNPPNDIDNALSRALILDLCVRQVSPNYARQRNEAVEDCLELANVLYPSQLAPLCTAGAAPVLLRSFLRSVCIPSVLDTIPIGTSTKDLLEERLRVLQLLHEDAHDSDLRAVEAEIVALSAEIAVMAERRNLDQQRIYVDTEGLAGRLTATLQGDFELYRQYLKLDPRKTHISNLQRIVKGVLPDALVLDINEIARSLTSETDRLFVKMVEQIRNEFAFSNDYGLDGYLSAGIRHGNLEALLREPFVTAGILGTFSGATGFLLPPLYSTVCKNISEAPHETVKTALREFAEEFQSLVNEVLAKWVRIETDERGSKAFFDFSMTQEDFRFLETDVSNAASSGEFVDLCIKYWWVRVHSCLERARTQVRTTLRERLDQALRHLVDKIHTVDVPLWSVLSDNVIGPTRAQIENAVETLAGWFQLAVAEDAGAIDPQLAVAVAQSTLGNLYPRTPVTWSGSTNSDGAKFERRSLKHWVDLLLTLLHNVIRHSSQKPCQADVSLTIHGSTVELIVSNPLGAKAALSIIDQRIIHVREQIEKGAYLLAVHREGSAGLMKVLKIARIDLRAPNSELVVERREQEFHVHLSIPDAPCVVSDEGRTQCES